MDKVNLAVAEGKEKTPRIIIEIYNKGYFLDYNINYF